MRHFTMLGPVGLCVSLALTTALTATPANARKVSALSGQSGLIAQDQCLLADTRSGNMGLRNTCTDPSLFAAFWIMPLALDTPGFKTITLTGRQTAANQIECSVFGVLDSGTYSVLKTFPAFATDGTYSKQSVTVPTSSAMAVEVWCSMVPNAPDARLLNLEYTP